MFYQSQRMKLECKRIVNKSDINDIYICQDVNSAAKTLYTLLVIKEHNTAKKYLKVFEDAEVSAQDSYVESFADGNHLCIVFEYKQERPLNAFYMGSSYTLTECEEICINVLLTCISSKLPYPILYLILKQNQLNFSKDHSVYFGYQIDLTELDDTITERDCVVECASVLLKMLEPQASQKAYSYRLLEKKISRKSYDRFTELYKDIRITAAPAKKRGIIRRIKDWFIYHQDTFMRILMIICLILGTIAILSLISQLIFGDIPWLRLFFNGFKKIGTESLV